MCRDCSRLEENCFAMREDVKMLADYHVHTEFSDDSREHMEEQVKKAVSLGLVCQNLYL